jgi:hypothetical protein
MAIGGSTFADFGDGISDLFAASADQSKAQGDLSEAANYELAASSGVVWLSKTVISGSMQGVFVTGSTVKSYGDNCIGDNATPVFGGSLTPVSTQ